MPLKRLELLLVLVIVAMRTFVNVLLLPRECLIIIIRQEKYLRGRTEEEIINLILEGIASSGQDVTYEIIPKETEAIKHAIKFAEEGSFITCLSDVVINAIEIVQEYLDRENEHGII
jgi:cyanophycin synthetase